MSPAAIRVLVAADGSIDPITAESIVGRDPGVEVVHVAENQTDWAGRDRHDFDAIVIACGGHSDGALELVEESVRDRPDRPIVVLCAGEPNGFVRQVFDSGADDIVVLTDAERTATELFFSLQKALARRSGAVVQQDRGHGRLICVLGPKGGTGKTLTAANLSAALGQAGKRTVLVDLDLQFGDLGLTMGLHPERTIYDLATAGGTLDADKAEAYLMPHSSGARVLLAPVRPDQAQAITVEFLRDLYNLLRTTNDFVVVDTPPGFTPEVIATIDCSSSVCLLGMVDAPSLKNARLGLETLELMGYPTDRIRLVLNRADTNVGISHADVVHILGRAPDVLVPSSREVVRAINAGEPLVTTRARSEAGKAFLALAELFVQETQSPAESAGRGRRRLVGVRS